MSNRDDLAAAFGRTVDPLSEYSDTFEEQGINGYDLFREHRLSKRELSDSTHTNYESTYKFWRQYMAETGRHPTCPSEEHVDGFIQWLQEEQENSGRTIKGKITHLNMVFEYWQDDPAFPHADDYNPFRSALKSRSFEGRSVTKQVYRMPVDELRKLMDRVDHIRDRAIITTGLKLGLRGGEIGNIQLQDIHIKNDQLLNHYSEIGTNPKLEGRKDAIYIPPHPINDFNAKGRDGNKSKRPRLLPLDEEMRQVLSEYLLLRPDNGESNLFLSKTKHTPLWQGDITKQVWDKHVRPHYPETEDYRAVTSHYARHRFSTWWKVEQELPRPLVKYMRGDRQQGKEGFDGIDHYIHAYYEDIEPLYREGRIYQIL